MAKDKEDQFTKCFKIGEEAAIDLINMVLKKVKKDFPKGEHAMGFGAMLSGIASAILYQGHRELERTLFERGEDLGGADRWLHVTFTKAIEALNEDKVPIEAKFFIGRKTS
jgi:hypothetical protein